MKINQEIFFWNFCFASPKTVMRWEKNYAVSEKKINKLEEKSEIPKIVQRREKYYDASKQKLKELKELMSNVEECKKKMWQTRGKNWDKDTQVTKFRKEVYLSLAPLPLVGVDFTAAYLPAESMLLRNMPVIFEKNHFIIKKIRNKLKSVNFF